MAKSGKTYAASNMENASSGADICAERVALARALAEGEREFLAIAVAGNTADPISPCGICQQSLMEFGGDIEVIMANLQGEAAMAKLSDILPRAFTGRSMRKLEGC